MSGCGYWIGHEPDGTGGHPCAQPTVERLVHVNGLCGGQGAFDVCADHLAEHLVEHLLVLP